MEQQIILMTNPTPTFEFDVFISYNQVVEPWAKQLATRLEQEDWRDKKLKVFFAPWDIKPGESIPERLEYALPRSRKVCLIMSPESAASEWVRVERYVTHHIDITERQRRLIPLYRSASEIPPFLQQINRIDFQDDAKFEDGYRLLLATIKDEPLPRGEQKALTSVAAPAPIPRSPVVGFVARRDSEGRDIIERLKTELAPPTNQLVALWGGGGVGKTTLAAEAARELADDFSNRVVWVSADLRTNLPFTTFLDEIATQLGNEGLRKLARDPKSEAVRALVATAPSLIVLDNFETISADERHQCLDFLQRVHCAALITTRQKLEHARSVTIAGMSPDEAESFLELLIEQTQDPTIFATYRIRLIETAEANPLIMEWIVGQIDLANDPEEVLTELTHGEGDAAHRVFDRSYNLPQLNDGGRAVLLALSLFTPSAGRPALAAVAGMDLGKGSDKKRFKKAQETLASLWLIKKADEGLRLAVAGLTRELTKARLATDLRAKSFPQRFVNRFLRYAQSHAEVTPEDYNALEFEKDNLSSATDLASTSGDWRSASRIADPLENLLFVRGYWDEALRISTLALNIVRSSNVESEIALWLHNAAMMYRSRGELGNARRLVAESLGISKTRGARNDVAACLHELAIIEHLEGRLDEAHRLYSEGLEIGKEIGSQRLIAGSLGQLGSVAFERNELGEAHRLMTQALDIQKTLGDQNGIATSLHALGVVAQRRDDLSEAKHLYKESLEIFKKLGDQHSIASALHQIGTVLEEEGHLEEAAELIDDALVVFEKLRSPHAEIARRSLERVNSKSS